MSRTVILSRGMLLAFGSLALCVASSAGAQESLDKNKTGAQLYASNCAACHKSRQSVTKTTGGLGLESFLREHYPATPEAAATIAAYLKGLEKRSAGSTRGRIAKRMSQAKPPEQPPSESKEDESPVQRALKRLLQAIKLENN
jgi:mono/diheme cytochrome c family protein